MHATIAVSDHVQMSHRRVMAPAPAARLHHWARNLGRDDRCVGAHGRESRYPYLDEGVVALLRALPLALAVII